MPSEVNAAGNAIVLSGVENDEQILPAQGVGTVIIINGVYLTPSDDTTPFIVGIEGTDNTNLIPTVTMETTSETPEFVLPYCTSGWATAPANTGIRTVCNGPVSGAVLFTVLPGRSHS
jgi:hypothetical protein